MKREKFIRELEYLLQDVSEADKEDAIAYYRDYLEDAGDDHEEEAIREFGSPERVAAIWVPAGDADCADAPVSSGKLRYPLPCAICGCGHQWIPG